MNLNLIFVIPFADLIAWNNFYLLPSFSYLLRYLYVFVKLFEFVKKTDLDVSKIL